MKKIVLIAFVLVLLSTPAVVRASTTFNMTQLGANPEAMAGVKAGDWAKYDVNVTWDSNDSEWQPPPSWADVINNTEYYIITVQMVVGTNITYQALVHFTNGTEQTTTAWMDIITGYGSEGGYHNDFIPANLSAGDDIYFLGKINETIPCMYVGMIRDTNHLHRTSEASFDGDPNSYNASENYYWDKATGIQTEYAGNYSSRTESYYYLLSMSFKIIQTNLWGPPVHNINTGLDYATIQEAINDNETLDGHTILVDAETYYEQVTINKSLSLIGEDTSTTIIDGNNTGTVVYVTANTVTVDGFTVQNGGVTEIGIHLVASNNSVIQRNVIKEHGFGIFVNRSNNCQISGNIAKDSDFGIFVVNSRNCTASDNTVSARVTDIDLHNSSYCVVMNNTANCYGHGIYLSDSPNCVVSDNTAIKTSGFSDGNCITLDNSDNCIVSGNTANKNTYGIFLAGSSNVTISNNTANNNKSGGIELEKSYGFPEPQEPSNNCTIVDNIAINNDVGIYMSSSQHSIIHNNIANNNWWWGIAILSGSNKCIISGNTVNNNPWGSIIVGSYECKFNNNTISNNEHGLELADCSDNHIYNNNLINNTVQAYVTFNYTNTWDDGYPSGGNYWSDYNGTDAYHPLENATGLPPDGIGDTPYIINANNTDSYPLMGTFSDFNATSEYHVQTICNSTISDFQFNGTAISFNVSGENDTTGFCRILIPTALMNGTYKVFVNRTEVQYIKSGFSNSTHSYLYFTYNHSTQEVVIIPEFPSWTPMLLILIVFTVALSIYKRRLPRTPTPNNEHARRELGELQT